MTDTRPPLTIRPLETPRLLLSPLDPETDAEDLHLMAADPEIHRFGDTFPSQSLPVTRATLRHDLTENGGMTWAIRLRDQPDALGTIGIFSDQGTRIRGIGWSLRRSHWDLGITSEAARIVVPFLLAQDGVDGLEAWVDAHNTRSLAVARHAGLTERARLPRTYRDRIAQTVVMAIAADEVPVQQIVSIQTTLYVEDVTQTISLLTDLLGLSLAWSVGDPPSLAQLSISPWSGSPGVYIARRDSDTPAAELTIDVGIAVDEIAHRAAALGLRITHHPENKPWHRRQFPFLLPNRHLIHIVGASSPPNLPA